jgi:hypothetical protein
MVHNDFDNADEQSEKINAVKKRNAELADKAARLNYSATTTPALTRL